MARSQSKVDHFHRAVRAVERGEVSEAIVHVQSLSHPELCLVTGLLERIAVARAVPDEDVQRLGANLARLFPVGTSALYRSLSRSWEDGWREDVAGHVAVERIAEMARGGAWAGEGHVAVTRHHLKQGRLDDAQSHALLVPKECKAGRSRALALVALERGAASKVGRRLLSLAVDAAKAGPIRFDAWSETLFLARLVEMMATAGVAAKHSAVRKAFNHIGRLAKKRKRRDSSSDGPRRAAVAAAMRAARDADDAWLQHVHQVTPFVWTSEHRWPVSIEVAVAYRAMGRAEDEAAALANIDERAWCERDELRALYPHRTEILRKFWSKQVSLNDYKWPPALTLLELLATLGSDIADELQGVTAPPTFRGEERLYALVHRAWPHRAAPMLTELDNPGDALWRVALSQRGQDAEVHETLHKALAHGWLPSGADADMIHDMTLVQAAEDAAATANDLNDKLRAFSVLSQVWMRDGRYDEAARCMARALSSSEV